jgi:ribosomal protein S18 acetylase RimI-like enzyme
MQSRPLLVDAAGSMGVCTNDYEPMKRVNGMDAEFRDYNECDYKQCEELANEAWGFDKIFYPAELANLAKRLYVKGSVVGSNDRLVVEVDGKVVGFLFGLNGLSDKPRGSLLFGAGFLWRLFRVKSTRPGDKKKILDAIGIHQKNRSCIIDRGRSEIVLFVIAKRYQGLGYGKALWSSFRSHCIASGVKSIIVETNKLGASGFYERLGFRHLADFHSPLHEYATPAGQPCVYEYINP